MHSGCIDHAGLAGLAFSVVTVLPVLKLSRSGEGWCSANVEPSCFLRVAPFRLFKSYQSKCGIWMDLMSFSRQWAAVFWGFTTRRHHGSDAIFGSKHLGKPPASILREVLNRSLASQTLSSVLHTCCGWGFFPVVQCFSCQNCQFFQLNSFKFCILTLETTLVIVTLKVF